MQRDFLKPKFLLAFLFCCSVKLFAQPSYVKVYLKDITALKTTFDDAGRDEVYILVSETDLENGKRFPENPDGNDDYYQLFDGYSTSAKGWTDRSQGPRDAPTFWEGCLKPGQQKIFVVQAVEQDNVILNGLLNVGRAIVHAFSADTSNTDEAVAYENEYKNANLPTENGILASFALTIKNSNGKIETRWRALKFCTLVTSENNSEATFHSDGIQKSHYSFTGATQISPVIPQKIRELVYVGDEEDGCKEPKVQVLSSNDTWVDVNVWDANKEIEVQINAEGYWFWRCGGNGEQSRGRTAFRNRVKVLKVSHPPGSIQWQCYDVNYKEIVDCK